MDFTYIIGLVLAAFVGALLQSVLLITRRDERYGFRAIFIVALALNGLLLIDWRSFGRGMSSLDAVALVSDLVLIPLVTSIGVVLGVMPVLLIFGMCRKVFALGRKNAKP